MLQNIFTHGGKILIHILICISQHINPQCANFCISFLIVELVFRQAVLTTVYLNDELMGVNIKICDIVADVFLTIDGNGKLLQKLIPELLFLRRHIFAQLLSIRDKLLIVIKWHSFVNMVWYLTEQCVLR